MDSDMEVFCLQVEVAGPVKEDVLIPADSEATVWSPVVAAWTAVQAVEEVGNVEQEVAAIVSAAEVVCPASDEVKCSPEMKV